MRIAAICTRDNVTKTEAEARIAVQFNYDGTNEQRYLQEIGAEIIENKGDLSKLKFSVLSALQKVLWNIFRETLFTQF